MSAAIAITRRDLTAGELRAGAARSREAQASRRMLAIALVLEGVDRKSAAETCGMDRQTLRDWVHRYNMTILASRNATAEDFQAVIAAIRDRALPVDRLVTHRTSLAGAARDIPRWATEKTGLIKALVELD